MAGISRMDAQAKSLGEWLRAKVVDVPAVLARSRRCRSMAGEPVLDDQGCRAGPDRGAGRAARRIDRHLRRRVRAGGPLRQRPGARRGRARRPGGRSGREVVARASCSTSAACGRAPSTCRSTPRTRRPRWSYFLRDAEPRGARLRARSGSTRSPGWRHGRRGSTGDDGPRGWRLAPRRRATPQPAERTDVERAGSRPGGHPLHVGHDRALQGRHAHATTTCARTRRRWWSAGGSRPTTCSCTPCRSSTPTACSWPPTWCCCPAASMIFLPGFDAGQVLAALRRATALMGVPTFYTRLLALPGLTARGRGRRAAVRVGLGAAAGRDPRGVVRADRPRHPRALRHDRDQHEHVQPLRRRATAGHGRASRCPASRSGWSIPRAGEVVATDEIGVLEVRGPTCSRATGASRRRRPRSSAPDGFFITGDLVEIDDDGYVHIVGRAKDLDHLRRPERLPQGGRGGHRRPARRGRVRGLRRAPPGLRRGGRRRRRARPAARSSRRPRCSAGSDDRLARFKQPKRVFVVDELPRNTMAKVQKNVLREQYGATFAGRTAVARSGRAPEPWPGRVLDGRTVSPGASRRLDHGGLVLRQSRGRPTGSLVGAGGPVAASASATGRAGGRARRGRSHRSAGPAGSWSGQLLQLLRVLDRA